MSLRVIRKSKSSSCRRISKIRTRPFQRRLSFLEHLEARYQLSVTFVDTENNDSLGGAQSVQSPGVAGIVDMATPATGVLANVQDGDPDFYRFQAEVQGELRVQVVNLGGDPSNDGLADNDLVVRIFDSSNSVIGGPTTLAASGAATTFSAISVNTGDVYKVSVEGATAIDDADYQVRMWNPDRDDDAGGNNNVRANAVSLGTFTGTLLATANHTITRPDRDYFSFTPNSAGPVEVRLLMPAGTGTSTALAPTNLGLRIRDAVGNIVSTSNTTTTNQDLATFTALASTQYFVEVYSGSVGQVNRYDLEITRPTATVTGFKYEDLDGDGFQNLNEPGVAGWVIYDDVDNDGVLDNSVTNNLCNGNATEPCAITAANGSYTLANLAPGIHRIKEVAQAGWTQTYPGSEDNGFHTINVQSNMTLDHIDFGNVQTRSVTISRITHAAEPTTNGKFRVSISSATTAPTIVSYSVSGTATPGAGNDYAALTGSAIIPANSLSTDIDVLVQDDLIVEPTETVNVLLTGAVGNPGIVIGTPNNASLDIVDNDSSVVTVAATVTPAAEPNTNGQFTVSLSNTSSTATTVSYTVTGTASNGVDYATLTGSVIIPANSPSAPIPVNVIDDAIIEANETVIVTLNSVTAGDPDITIGGANSATVTINDDDTGQVTIAATVTPAAEPTTNGQFTVSLNKISSTPTTVSYTVTGTAINGTDYVISPSPVIIPAGSTSAPIPVNVIDDAIIEPSETVIVTLNSVTTGDPDITIGGANSATVTINDDDTGQVTIAATLTPAAEPTTNGQFTVSLNKISSTPTTVSYTVTGTAINGTDYVISPSPVIIPAGSASATIPVNVIDDAIIEASETVIVTLNSVTAGDPDITIGGANSATVTINDNDTGQVTIAATITPAAEPNTNGQFTVNLNNTSSTATTVSYTVTGTASNGVDYATITGLVIISAGSTSAPIPVNVIDDAIIEASETVIVTLNSVTAGDPDITIGGANSATVTINDDDSGQVTIAATITPAAEPNINGQFTVSLNKISSTPTTVSYTVTGTAINGTDYVISPSPVIIPAGSTSAPIPVNVIDDAIIEASETVVITLNSVTAGDPDITIGGANSATVTINDDDSGQVTVAATITPAAEPNTDGQFTVNLSKTSSTATTVSYTVSGTASNGTDYVTLTGTVTIPANSPSTVIDVDVIDDAIIEASETVVVTLNSVTAGDPDITVGGANAATVTMNDNDTGQVTIAATTTPAAEPNTDGQFTVSLSNTSTTATTISYTVTGTASNGNDYTTLTGSVTIPANSPSAVIDVDVIDDAIIEANETVIVTLNSVTAGSPGITIGGANSDTVTIHDDDSGQVSIVATTPSAAEPSTDGQFTVSLSKASSTPTIVGYTVTGTAANGTDYTLLTGTVTIPAGPTPAVIDVDVIDDALFEGTESVIVTLISVTSGDPDISIGGANSGTVFISDDDVLPAFKGLKFHDLNSDGNKTGDPGLGGWVIELYKDDGDGVFEPTVPGGAGGLGGDGAPIEVTTTSSNVGTLGRYTLGNGSTTPTGIYFIREVNKTGWFQTTPASFYTINYTTGSTHPVDVDFGNNNCDDKRTVTSAGTTVTSERPGILTIELFSSTPFTVNSASPFRVYDATTKTLSAAQNTQPSRTSEFAKEPNYQRIDIFIPTVTPFVPTSYTVNLAGLVGSATLRWTNSVNVSPSTLALQVTGNACGDFVVVRDDPAAGGDDSDAKRIFVGVFTGNLDGGSDLKADGLRYNADIMNGMFSNPTISRVEVSGQGGDDFIRVGSEITVQQSTINGGVGNDVIRAGNQKATVSGGTGLDFVWGGSADDILNGDSDSDWMFGAAGADRLSGLDGNDILGGGDSDDPLVRGGNGDDAISGGIGADRLLGETGAADIGYRESADLFFSGFEICRTTGVIAGCTTVAQDDVDLFLKDRFRRVWDDNNAGDGHDTLEELINNLLF